MTIRKETACNLVLIILGAGFLLYTLEYPLDSWENPGPGVFPFAAGIVFMGLAGWQLFRGLRNPETSDHDEGIIRIDSKSIKKFLQRNEGEKKALTMIAILVLYLLAVQWIGFFVSTLAFVIIFSRLTQTEGWGKPVALSVGVSLFSYLLFEVWLKMSLPRGLLF
jgi:putative tricarboxylic transport membrane protein